MSINDFEIIKQLGKGAFGSVSKVRKISDGKIYALKSVKIGKLSQKEKESALNEIRILYSLNNPNIIYYYDGFYDETSRTLNIIMEFAEDGDISGKIKELQIKKEKFSEETIWNWIIQMLEGIKYLHNNKIIHRDLKCANIFLNKKGIIKIGDLNVSKVSESGLAKTQTGTPYYCAPEIWKDEEYDYKCDIWSIGCIIYELCTFVPPFRGTSLRDLSINVLKGIYNPIPKYYSNDLSEIISKMLIVDPNKRYSIDQLLNCDIIKKRINSIKDSIIPFIVRNNKKNIGNVNLIKTIKFPKNLKDINKIIPKRVLQKEIEEEMMLNDEFEITKSLGPQKFLEFNKNNVCQNINNNNIVNKEKKNYNNGDVINQQFNQDYQRNKNENRQSEQRNKNENRQYDERNKNVNRQYDERNDYENKQYEQRNKNENRQSDQRNKNENRQYDERNKNVNKQNDERNKNVNRQYEQRNKNENIQNPNSINKNDNLINKEKKYQNLETPNPDFQRNKYNSQQNQNNKIRYENNFPNSSNNNKNDNLINKEKKYQNLETPNPDIQRYRYDNQQNQDNKIRYENNLPIPSRKNNNYNQQKDYHSNNNEINQKKGLPKRIHHQNKKGNPEADQYLLEAKEEQKRREQHNYNINQQKVPLNFNNLNYNNLNNNYNDKYNNNLHINYNNNYNINDRKIQNRPPSSYNRKIEIKDKNQVNNLIRPQSGKQINQQQYYNNNYNYKYNYNNNNYLNQKNIPLNQQNYRPSVKKPGKVIYEKMNYKDYNARYGNKNVKIKRSGK